MLATEANFPELLSSLGRSKRVCVDLETTGLNSFKQDVLCGVAVLVTGGVWYVPFRHADSPNLPLGCLQELLVELARVPVWTGWNLKFDIKFIQKEGGALPERLEDVMLASHLCDENQPNFKLKDTARRIMGVDAADEETELAETLRKLKLGKGDLWKLPAETVRPYAEADVILTEKLRTHFMVPALKRDGLFELWRSLNEYLVVVDAMERRGLLLDLNQVRDNIEQARVGVEEAKAGAAAYMGYEFNPNSPAQVKVAFAGAGIDVPDTRNETIGHLDHPLVRFILDYRRWSKVTTTYYKRFMDQCDDEGVLHPNLNMIGTVTGRFSCSSPNLQAIPRKEAEFHPKNLVKQAFRARPGYWLVQADYKQAEVYLGSAYARAKLMIQMLSEGRDPHQETASLLGIPRAVAKRLNFSMQYGIGARALAKNMRQQAGLDISEEQAAEYIKRYNTLHPEFRRLYDIAYSRGQANGHIRLFTGRMRRYNDLEIGTQAMRASPPHKASSNLIQGGVAEVMRLASTALYKQLYKEGVYQLLHIHDSTFCEVPEGREDLVDEIGRIMTDPEITCTEEFGMPTGLSLKVDIEYGSGSWYDLQPYKKEG